MFKKILFLFFALMCIPVFAYIGNGSIITGDAKVSKDFAPDTAKIRFYVESSGLNINDIKAQNDKIVNDAINKLKSKLNSDEQITTVAYSVNSVYSYKDKIKVFQKYEVKNGFEVKLKDLNKISDIIKIAADSGINRVDNLKFYIEDNEKFCNELLKEAAKNAKTRAEIAAQALDVNIGKPKSINTYCSSSTPKIYHNRMLTLSAADSAEELSAPQVIEAGSINITGSVSAIYYLK